LTEAAGAEAAIAEEAAEAPMVNAIAEANDLVMMKFLSKLLNWLRRSITV